MKPFKDNSMHTSNSIFTDCTFKPNTPELSLMEYVDIARQKFQEQHTPAIGLAKDALTYNDISPYEVNMDCEPYENDIYDQREETGDYQYEDDIINDADSSPLELPVSPANNDMSNISHSDPAIKKSPMQIAEDHLLSKVYIRRLYGVVYLYNGKYYVPLTEQDYSILLRRESDDGIISILKSYRAFSDGFRFLSSNPDIEFDNYESLSFRFKTFIAFENTLLDARTGAEYTHNPDYPVFFGINARYKKHPARTPCWDAFLTSTSRGDKKIETLIYEMLGYLMLQGNDGKCFFVLATAPNSGKSLLGDFIGALFPDSNVSHMAIDELGDRFSLGGLWKTTVNVSMDIPESTLNNRTVSLVKTLTGDSKIAAEEKYMPKCTALNRLKLVFGTNSSIRIATQDQAFWNRLVIVPFLYEVPKQKQDTALLSHIIAEKDNIVSKSIPYATRLIKRNYEFTLPDAAAAMKQEWSGYSRDVLNDFFSECCRFTDSTPGIPAQELFGHFQQYCNARLMPCMIKDTTQFSKTVKQRYPRAEQSKRRASGYNNPISIFDNIEYCPKQDI